MELYYIVIVAILALLAISDLIVGVSNDAVNFLNSAIGSKAAPFRIIMVIAALGILIGATFSSGMMEVARKGIFHPNQFYFNEIMVIFLAVMMTDIVLLDLFNTFGLPTSTTVSIVFELLGASVAVSIIKITTAGDSINTLSTYINSGSALLIITGILLSVFIAFTVGVIIQWFVRILFTFNYEKTYRYFGSVWGGIAITIITYFILIKGAKGSSLLSAEAVHWMQVNTKLILLFSFFGWTILLQFLVWIFRLNILKIIVLTGTFALAMAFAGNDLVNFIGVPLAGYESFKAFTGSGMTDPAAFSMYSLSEAIKTPIHFLLLAGLVMVVTLFVSKKARTVTQTTIDLSRQDEGHERFDSSVLARNIVRGTIKMSNIVSKVLPGVVRKKINHRFRLVYSVEKSRKEKVSFDLVRASVNLVVASALIALGTSLRLPLSTTYVTFMVAMGTSLADRAWGRESAVYRITGVITVIGGWFFTALCAFTVSFILAYLIHLGDFVVISILILLAIVLLIKNYSIHKKRDVEKQKVSQEMTLSSGEVNSHNIYHASKKSLANTFKAVSKIFDQSINGLTSHNRKQLKKIMNDLKELDKETERLKNNLPRTIARLHEDDLETGHFYIQIIDYLREITHCIKYITIPAFQYIDNNHPPLNADQISDLTDFRKEMVIFFDLAVKVMEKDCKENSEKIKKTYHNLIEEIAKLNKKQLKRIKNRESGTKNSTLYLNNLNESKSLVLFTENVLKTEQLFMEYAQGKKS